MQYKLKVFYPTRQLSEYIAILTKSTFLPSFYRILSPKNKDGYERK